MESTRQKILELLDEEKSETEIQKILKCSKAYIRSCKSSLALYTNKKKTRLRALEKRGVVTLKCVDCGIVLEIRISNLEAYTAEVRKSWRCLTCATKKRR